MKVLFYLVLPFIIFFLLLLSCERGLENQQSKLLSISSCKNFLSPSYKAGISDTRSCIEYSFCSEKRKLTIKHINAGFNCCLDTVYCDTDIVGDTIYVHEIEVGQLCKCNCLYDLEFEIYNVEAKKYTVKIEEPYVGDMKKFLFDIDITSELAGSFCVTRPNYPWSAAN